MMLREGGGWFSADPKHPDTGGDDGRGGADAIDAGDDAALMLAVTERPIVASMMTLDAIRCR